MLTLSILIPTYNRSNKLLRLLKLIEKEIIASNLSSKISVLVSDNASIDDTEKIMHEFSTKQFEFTYFRQKENLGFDGNVRFLYEQAELDYVWYIGDDDILLPGSIAAILKVLNDNSPDVLLFSFVQPPDSKDRVFNFINPVEVITEPERIIELIFKYPKISIFVLKKVIINEGQAKELETFLGNGFYFISLTYSIFGASANPKLCIISQPLASCDEDWRKFNFKIELFLNVYKIFTHSFVKRYLPDLAKAKADDSYCTAIQFLYAVKAGSLEVTDIEYYNKIIKELPVRYGVLLRKPKKTILSLILLKMRLVPLCVKIKRKVNTKGISQVL